jgi:hydroxymethylpyrimidine/phosphomethylpyrimidine kinase
MSAVITPNIYEAEALIGKKIKTIEDMKSAAGDILKLNVKKVVVKGGHLREDRATDVLYDGKEYKELHGHWVKTKNTHGTGCTYSSAIAANIALGKTFFEAVSLAKQYITGAIEHSLSIGQGYGPTHHFFDLYAKAGMG